MKKAEEYLNDEIRLAPWSTYDAAIRAINAAREDAINEIKNNIQIVCKEANYDGGNLTCQFAVDMDIFDILLKQIK